MIFIYEDCYKVEVCIKLEVIVKEMGYFFVELISVEVKVI